MTQPFRHHDFPDAGCSADCEPLSLTRNIGDFPIGNQPLAAHQQKLAGATEVAIHPHAWIESSDFSAWLASGKSTLSDVTGVMLATRGISPNPENVFHGAASFPIRYPWDLLRANEQFLSSLTENRIEGEIHPMAAVEGVIHLGKNSRILPGVYLEGNIIIGENCRIGPNCHIRGNTSIGAACHIGQSVEIKNSLILSHTNAGHLSYVGDSILGENVNLGGGTIISNFRHDGKTHRSIIKGKLIDTGRLKFGAILGDGVRTGINTAIYPGRKLWPRTRTLPGEIIQRDLER